MATKTTKTKETATKSQPPIPNPDDNWQPVTLDQFLPRLSEGAYSFAARFAFPPVDNITVIEGWQNFVALPQKTNDYIVFTLRDLKRRGTNIHAVNMETLHEEPGIGIIKEMFEVAIQFDVCSNDSLKALSRASVLHTLCRDAVGVNFWKDFGISMCYADDPVAVPFVDEGKSWVARYMVTAHATFWAETTLRVDYFTNAQLKLQMSR